MKKIILLAVLFVAILFQSFKNNEQQYKASIIGFYNLENLFDIYDDPEIRDEEFLPEGSRQWTEDKYQEKLANLAKVISEVGTDISPDGLAILGTAESENLKVLEDLVKQDAIKKRNYQIVHYDSPDKRGIDCALLYNPDYFTVESSTPILVDIKDDEGERVYTRDILYVKGLMDGEEMHIFVNHWPSRSGGEKRSRPRRNAAAQVCKDKINSILINNPNAKVLVMGDLNDDPISPSVKKILKGKNKKEKVKDGEMYNPMADYFKKGIGTLAYRDAWSLFDQILVTKATYSDKESYVFHKAKIFNKKYLVQKSGRYKGYPFRTFAGGEYQGGYSDHFPVYSIFLKEVN